MRPHARNFPCGHMRGNQCINCFVLIDRQNSTQPTTDNRQKHISPTTLPARQKVKSKYGLIELSTLNYIQIVKENKRCGLKAQGTESTLRSILETHIATFSPDTTPGAPHADTELLDSATQQVAETIVDASEQDDAAIATAATEGGVPDGESPDGAARSTDSTAAAAAPATSKKKAPHRTQNCIARLLHVLAMDEARSALGRINQGDSRLQLDDKSLPEPWDEIAELER